jgi:hypothetical protein
MQDDFRRNKNNEINSIATLTCGFCVKGTVDLDLTIPLS